jgi:hypothetical protein
MTNPSEGTAPKEFSMTAQTERRTVLDLLESRTITMEEAERLLEALAGPAGCQAAAPTVVVEVAADHGTLQQVFTNLSRAFAVRQTAAQTKERIL